MLHPSAQWYWFCDKQYLMLSLNDTMQFQTAYLTSRLINVPSDKQSFSIDDSSRYVMLAEQLQHLNVSAAQLSQVLINAVAAMAFHKPVALRSWYFSEQSDFGAIRQLASLENQTGKGDVVVIEQDNNVATCMVISDVLMLNENKQLKQFELIKVMKNRLIPYITPSHCYSRSA